MILHQSLSLSLSLAAGLDVDIESGIFFWDEFQALGTDGVPLSVRLRFALNLPAAFTPTLASEPFYDNDVLTSFCAAAAEPLSIQIV